jgi:transposase-like protein
MRKPRKNYSPTEKVAILRRHLIEKVPVSDLCDEHQLQPTQFYAWQKQFFENGAAAFVQRQTERTCSAVGSPSYRLHPVRRPLPSRRNGLQCKQRWWASALQRMSFQFVSFQFAARCW